MPYKDPKELAKAIFKILSAKAAAVELGNKGYKFVKSILAGKE